MKLERYVDPFVPALMENRSLEDSVRDALMGMTSELIRHKDAILREHLYARCDDCGEIVPIDRVRIIEDVTRLSSIDAEPPRNGITVTIKQDVFEIKCLKCLNG